MTPPPVSLRAACRAPTPTTASALCDHNTGRYLSLVAAITMDPNEVAQFWEHQARQWHPDQNPLAISEELLQIANATPERLRDAITAAARAVGHHFCSHGNAEPQPLPAVESLADRRAAAAQHPGLCGYHHAVLIGSVDFNKAVERKAPAPVTAKALRNQVSDHDSRILSAGVAKLISCTRLSLLGTLGLPLLDFVAL